MRGDEIVHDLRDEWCVAITGQVRAPPGRQGQPALATGDIEVVAETLEVLNPAAPLPFPISDQVQVGEEARLRYRYLDPAPDGRGQRDPHAQRGQPDRPNRDARAQLRRDRDADPDPLDAGGCPRLPGAARLQPGSWYALPQSPQLFKQLLMVGGMERYYQIARCYRDEDFRADRQPEFTQLDIEMSFVDQTM